jgi:hypothetical protein
VKKKRISTSVTVDPDKDAKRRKLGIKLSTAVDIGLDLIFRTLLQDTEKKEEPVTPKKSVKPEPVDKKFNQKLTTTVKEASERYKISGMEHDKPFEDDKDFLHYISKRAEHIHIDLETLERCVIDYVDGKLTPEILMKMTKKELFLMVEE